MNSRGFFYPLFLLPSLLLAFRSRFDSLPSRRFHYDTKRLAQNQFRNSVQTKESNSTINGKKREENDSGFGTTVCRIVALSDAKIPCSKNILPPSLDEPPHILEKLDAIYHAMSHVETGLLDYMEPGSDGVYSKEQERKLVTVLKNSLEDAGFELLSQRDLDLCDALNVGYLLRLSIDPDVRDLDPKIHEEFYHEQLCNNKNNTDQVLYDGRVLVYRRGYSSEVTTGRLLLPKLDYLQASLVSRSVAVASRQVGLFERNMLNGIKSFTKSARNVFINIMGPILTPVSSLVGWNNSTEEEVHINLSSETSENMFFKLARYGGRKVKLVGSPDLSDALTPFLICEITNTTLEETVFSTTSKSDLLGEIALNVNHDIYEALNQGAFTCQYDGQHRQRKKGLPPTLLERVSISSIVDVFTREGRAEFAKRFFSKSELVEPTFEEVVVIWRPCAGKQRKARKLLPPQMFYDLAEVLDMEKMLPQKPTIVVEPDPLPLQIRAFHRVPMANLPAVLPKTKLVFRPADALLNDFISVATFALISFSFKFDNPRLDLIAVISFGLWTFRTIIRYSNKLARYDLLVKKFLTSKIVHRDAGALKYIVTEAGSQRALRAALVHSWLVHDCRHRTDNLTRSELIQEGYVGVNEALCTDQFVDINIRAALNDLEDLGLIEFSSDTHELISVKDETTAVSALTSIWMRVFEQNDAIRLTQHQAQSS